MIVTVTANAAIDRTLRLERLEPGSKQTLLSDHSQAGGKGVNVARLLHSLSVPTRAVVVVGGSSGERIVRDLEDAGIDTVPVEAPGESRTCLELVEIGQGRVTQLHGTGVQGSGALSEKLIARVVEEFGEASWLALCGSLPHELPEDTYARLVGRAHAREVRVAVDTSGAALGEAWGRRPDLLRVNRSEVAEAFGRSTAPREPSRDSHQAALTVISDGSAESEAWTIRGERWQIEPPRVPRGNPVGCGDAMLAGLLTRLTAGEDHTPRSQELLPWTPETLEEALRFATALASADVASPTAGRTDPVRAEALYREVRIRRS